MESGQNVSPPEEITQQPGGPVDNVEAEEVANEVP